MKEKWMLHPVYSKRNRTLPLLGFLLMVLALLGSMLLNQTYLHPTHAASACQGAPAGFDPTSLNVTNAQLEQYGLPARPSASQKPQEYAFWLKLVQNAKHRVCATSTTSQMAFSGTSAVAPLSMKTANTEYHSNFSGYTATGSSVGYVSGTWEVPSEQLTNGNHNTATLQNLIQLGFPSTLLTIGTQEAHTETYNSATNVWTGSDDDQFFVFFQGAGGSYAAPTDFPIHAGDAVNAQIGYDNSTATPQWNAFIEDTSTNASFSMTYTAGALPNSAFWGEYTAAYPLYNFGTVAWSGNEMADSSSSQGDSKPIAQWSNSDVQMKDTAGDILASPSALDIAGGGFTANWQNCGLVVPNCVGNH
jgi:hypothetical protein